ncbi:unnamed protein product, partial [Effrenium voratum]
NSICCAYLRRFQESFRSRLAGLYTTDDMRFVVYQTLLSSAMYAAAVFSGCTGRMSLKTGLDFEIWVALFLEAMLTTSICAFLTAQPVNPSKAETRNSHGGLCK